MASCCSTRPRDHRFDAVFGPKRSTNTRPDYAVTILRFRTVHGRPNVQEFNRLDFNVTCCEQCGGGGFLRRDWDDPVIPALCTNCLLERDPADAMCCEDWCDTEDLDHSGLCSP